jgi:uncharacterized membrane protein YqjE
VDTRIDTPVAEPSLAQALERLLIASQRVVSDRIDLAMLDLHGLTSRTVRSAMFGGLAIGLGLGGWFALVGAAVSALALRLPLWAALAIAGTVNLAAAALIAGAAARTSRGVPSAVARVASAESDPTRRSGT